MEKRKSFYLSLVFLLVTATVLAAGCMGSADNSENGLSSQKVVLVSTPYGTATSSGNVMKLVLEEAGYDVELSVTDVGVAWQSIAAGSSDCYIDAWLPITHGQYLKKYEEDVVYVKDNLHGTRCGLVVPSYVDIDSIEELNASKDRFDGKIIGVEPGAGIMVSSEKAVEEYNLDYDLLTGSEMSMITTLMGALENEEWVVVTGWSPHWKFQRWDLKYLEDPKGIYGADGDIVTFTRKGFKADMPEACAVLERFEWTPEDMESVMYDMENGMSAEEAAAKWIKNNRDKVDMWLGME